MALLRKTVDDYKGITGFLDWKTMGGGAGGAPGGTTGGLGSALVGALAAGALAAGAGSAGSGTAKPNIKLPESNAELDEQLDTSAPNSAVPDSAVPDSAVQETQTPDPELPDTESAPEIKDETSTNVEQAIDNTDMLEMLKGLRDEQWAREDALREHIESREDSAFSRAISDMRRSGVNVNLVGAQPAESGGGITNATGMDLGMLETALNNEGQTLIAMINNGFKGDENTKDRIMEGITSALSLTGQIVMAYLFSKGKSNKGGG